MLFTKNPLTLTDLFNNHSRLLELQPGIDEIGDPDLIASYLKLEKKTLDDGAASAIDFKAKNGLSVLPPLLSPGSILYDVDFTQTPPTLVVVTPLNSDEVPALGAIPPTL